EFLSRAAGRGWLRLWFLEVEGRAVAAWLGFRFAGAASYYQAGRDPAWDRYAVGFVLLVHTMRAALEEGCSEYRFLRGGEEFKYRFATDDPGLETFALARGPAARAAVAAAAAAPRDAVRRLAGRVGGQSSSAASSAGSGASTWP